MGMQCRRGPLGHLLQCTMHSQPAMNCALAALSTPTVLEAGVQLETPHAVRRSVAAERQIFATAFYSVPFIPPRA